MPQPNNLHPEWAGLVLWLPNGHYWTLQLYPDQAHIEVNQDYERVKLPDGRVVIRSLPRRVQVNLSGLMAEWDGRTRPPSRRYALEERKFLEGLVNTPSLPLESESAPQDPEPAG